MAPNIAWIPPRMGSKMIRSNALHGVLRWGYLVRKCAEQADFWGYHGYAIQHTNPLRISSAKPQILATTRDIDLISMASTHGSYLWWLIRLCNPTWMGFNEDALDSSYTQLYLNSCRIWFPHVLYIHTYICVYIYIHQNTSSHHRFQDQKMVLKRLGFFLGG